MSIRVACPPAVKHVTCPDCGTLLEYGDGDVHLVRQADFERKTQNMPHPPRGFGIEHQITCPCCAAAVRVLP